MTHILRQSTQVKVVIGPVVAVGDGFTPVTTLALGSADEAELLKHDAGSVTDISGATFAAITSADGYYNLTLTTSHTDTCGMMTVLINDDSLCLPVKATFQVVEEAVYDAFYAASALGYVANAPVNVAQFGGSNGTFASGRPEVNVSHYGGTAGTFSGGRPEVNTTHIAGSAVSTSSAQIGVNVVNAGGTAWGSGAITAAAIADGAIDRATFAADTGLQTVRSNTAQAGGATSITLDASASSTTDFYKHSLIYLTGGTGAGQVRLCTAYNGTTKVATVTPAWATNPDNTSTFAVLPAGLVNVEAFGGTAGTFSSGRPEVNTTHAAGTAWGSGAITAASIATGAITSAKFAAGAIDAAALAADAAAEIAAAVWVVDASVITIGTFGQYLSQLRYCISGLGTSYLNALPPDYFAVVQILSLVSQTVFGLSNGPTADDAMNGWEIVIYSNDGGTSLNRCVSVIADYVASTKQVTLLFDPGVFTIENGDYVAVRPNTAVKPTVANRTLDVTATGAAGIDWGNVENKTTTNALTNTTISTSQQVASVSGSVGSISGVTFPTNFASLGINSSGHISRVTLVDTTTTNTDMITAAGIRTAVGLGAANLDSQLQTTGVVVASHTSAAKAEINTEVLDVINVDTLIDGKTIAAATRYIAASTAGRVSGAGTTTETFLGLDEATTRLTITVDSSGNRTDVTYG